MQKAHAMLARESEFGAEREVEQARGRSHGLILGLGIAEAQRNLCPVI
jgi:hypothetical protein